MHSHVLGLAPLAGVARPACPPRVEADVSEEPKDDDRFSTSAASPSCNLADLRTAQGGVTAGICLQKPGGSSGDWRQAPRGERKRKHTRLRPARTVSHEASRERLIELPRG